MNEKQITALAAALHHAIVEQVLESGVPKAAAAHLDAVRRSNRALVIQIATCGARIGIQCWSESLHRRGADDRFPLVDFQDVLRDPE